MGTAGRKPKPTAIKKLAGNPGKRPLNGAEPQPGEADLRVPYGRLPEDGQKLWRVLAPQLAETGVLKATDLPALEMMCLHYAVVRRAWDELDKGDLTSPTGQGSVKRNPVVAIFRENSAAFHSYATDFGLTPSSRVRIKVEPVQREKTLAELLFDGVEDGVEDAPDG